MNPDLCFQIGEYSLKCIICVWKPLEKARVIDPFGHAGLDPSGKIRLTL